MFVFELFYWPTQVMYIFCFQAPEPEPPVAKGPPKSTTIASGKKGKLDEKPVEEQLDPEVKKLRQQR